MHIPFFTAIIPARYASTRFPGKPLADLKGKTMIQRVYEQVEPVIDYVVVATDDERIFAEVERFGGKAVMTSSAHNSGTDRCAEALDIIEKEKKLKSDVVINVQGDEPFIRHDQIEALKSCFTDDSTQIATLINPIREQEVLTNPNRAKVIIDVNGFALYFSRSVVPYIRNKSENEWSQYHKYYQHIGIYAYRTGILKEIVLLPQSALEKAESLEQLRWLENGYRIKTAVTEFETYGIDTPGDLRKIIDMGIL